MIAKDKEMNWNRIEGEWKHFTHDLKEQWDKLSDADVAVRLYSLHDGRAVPSPFGFSINVIKERRNELGSDRRQLETIQG